MTPTPRYPFLNLADANAPYLDDIEAAVSRVLRSGRYVGGEECERLEANVAALSRTPHAVGVSNGLDALRLTLRAAVLIGLLREGDEVIVQANTYVASVLAIVDTGLVPVLADIDPDTLNLDTARLDACLTPRTRAVMPVHLYGRVCWDERLALFARRHSLFVIEDNAQAIGAVSHAAPGLFGSNVTGGLGHAGAYSFYPTKNVGAMGDAGAVATNIPQLADAVRALANYGCDRRYHNIYAGFNCRLDPVQAAVLNVKWPHIDRENDRRRRLADIYTRTLAPVGCLIAPKPEESREMVWHQYVLRVDTPEPAAPDNTPQPSAASGAASQPSTTPGGTIGSASQPSTALRDTLRARLAERGVQTDIHYATPPHLQPCFAGLPHGPLPVTERAAATMLSLPIGRTTSEADAAQIAAIVSDVAKSL